MAEVASSSAIIQSMVLNIGNENITLTMEQAKRLHSALQELFGDKKTAQYVPSSPLRGDYPNWARGLDRREILGSNVYGRYDSKSREVFLSL